jgi:hypothetical protein
MSARRTPAVLLGALVLAGPLCSSCGLTGRGVATSREYTPARGANDRDAEVDVLGAVVVSAEPGSGTFVATLVSNLADETASIESIAGSGGDQGLRVGQFEPVELDPQEMLNLAGDERAPRIRGEFEAGQYLELELVTGTGKQLTMDVPVVADDREFVDLDTRS